MNSIQKDLFSYRDQKYAEFQRKLTPGIDQDSFIGVRVPILKNYAKQIKDEKIIYDFLNELPHKYYDENMLHSVILSTKIKDYDECLKLVNEFLPYVDNWAVCDILSPKCFSKNIDKLIKEIKVWSKSKHVYTCRFGIEMLMSFYLDENFKEEYLNIPSKIRSNEYYVNMMLAWFYATALVKKWDETIIYLKDNRLDTWIHNKTIQKSIESYRISDKQKTYLKTLKRSK